MQEHSVVGVSEHGNSAILVTVSSDLQLLDRRRVTLTQKPLPTHPYHHQGSWAVGRYKHSPWAQEITLEEAISLVKKVEIAAALGAQNALDQLIAELETPIEAISIRRCPPMPATIEGRIRDHRAQTYADTVMYRQALAEAALGKKWRVFWYDSDTVLENAAKVIDTENPASFLKALGKPWGPPWQAKHKLAAAAAIAAQDLL